MTHCESPVHLTRRSLLKASASAAAATGTVQAALAKSDAVQTMPLRLRVNGTDHALQVDPRVTLLDALREQMQLTGTKKGCDQGQCGACTVLVNGRRLNACLTLAVMHDGDDVRTIEGLGTPERLHPMQTAFVRRDAFQCGYCTPGQICSALGMLDEIRRDVPSYVSADLKARAAFSDGEVRERMSGNICRCAAYANIVAAIGDAKDSRA